MSSCAPSPASASRRARPRSTSRPSSPGTSSSSSARTASSPRSPTRSTAASARARFRRSISIEEISKACATSGLILAVQELGALAFKLAGSDEQKQRFLPRLASGEALAAYALTEPGSGSDAAAMLTVARRDGDEYVLDGSKRFITNAGVAEVYVVFAKTDPAAGHAGSRPSWSSRARRDSRSGGSSRRWGSRARRPARCFSTTAGCRGEPDRRGRRGVPARDADPRPLATGDRRAGARARPGRHRLRARVRPLARDDGRADREAPADRGDARRHGDELRGGARPSLPLRPDDRRRRRGRRADEALGDDEALLHRHGDGRHDRRRPGARRLRVHAGVPGRADDARRQGDPDLRGHEPDPAARDRPRDAPRSQ